MSSNPTRTAGRHPSGDAGLAPLNRSPLFLAQSTQAEREVLLLDRFELAPHELSRDHGVFQSLRRSIDLSAIGPVLDAEQMIGLLAGQFDSAAEFVYGHPIWADIRAGNERALHSYILETRHYLAAASSRMAPSIHPAMGLGPMALLLSHHLLEEWDHERFFSQALEALGCRIDLVRSARPLPATLEWVHLTRFIAAKSPLCAAACSGFMEHSSTETGAVKGWHALLERSNMLPASAIDAMFGHFETDLGLDHAANWQRAVRLEPLIPAAAASDVLNHVCTIAEMIYRWLSMLSAGSAADAVMAMQLWDGPPKGPAPHPLSARIFDGTPVLASTMLSAIAWAEADVPPGARIVTAASYALGHLAAPDDTGLAGIVARHCARPTPAAEPDAVDPVEALAATARGWLRAIDGHDLWQAMLERGDDALITGYFLENFHYLASATHHIAPAIAATTEPRVRRAYIAHLEDELEHCDILRAQLVAAAEIPNPEALRPLPTTLAFVGQLQLLARSDWRAYVIVSSFLQSSLAVSRETNRQNGFYEQVAARTPRLAPLVQTMAAHDAIDAGLDHDQTHLDRLAWMLEEGPATPREIGLAAIVPGLAWGFLDGILRHYGSGAGAGALLQRTGWSA